MNQLQMGIKHEANEHSDVLHGSVLLAQKTA